MARGPQRAVPPNVPRDVAEWKRTPGAGPIQGGGMGAPTPSAMGAITQKSLFVPPPWFYPPGDAARYFFREDDRTLAAGPVAQTEMTGTIFNVPAQNVAVIRELNFNVNNLLTTSDITFRLLLNDTLVEGYTIKIFPRAASSVSVAFSAESTVVHVNEAAKISITVQVGDAGAYQVGASHRGWFYSKDIWNKYGTFG